MVYNKIHVAFGALRKINGPPLQWQYNEKQILVISGLDLPEYYAVDFMNEGDTDTITMTASTAGVEIPDQFLLTGKKLVAYIVVVDGESVNTVGQITFPVNVRGRRTDISPKPAEQQQIDALVDALNSGVTRAETAAEAAEQAETEIEAYVERAETAASNAETSASNAAESEINALNSARVATTKANQAASSAQSASQDASAANASAGSADQSAASARESASAASESVSRAAGSASDASASAGQAAASASAAADSASQAAGSAQSASRDASAASQSATNAANSESAASSKAQEAASKATEAGNAKDAAVTAKEAAETAQGKAEDAQAAAEEAAEEAASAVANKAPVIINTASGEIANFADGADDMPIKKLVGTIVPVQDLHGYDNPWPAGGGKNKINAPDITLNSAGYIFNGAVSIPAGTYTMSLVWSGAGTPSASFGIFDSDGNALVSGSHSFPYTFTLSADATSARFYAAASGTYSNIQIEPGSSATSFAPYENICPISGWDGANVWQRAVNLFDKDAVVNGKWLNVNTGAEENTTANYSLSDYIPVKANVTYTIAEPNSSRRWLYDLSKNPISKINAYKFTPTVDGFARITIFINVSPIESYMVVKGNNLPSTYVPYVGNTLPIIWQDEAGTIYGGSFTLNEDGSVDVVATIQRLTVDGTYADLSMVGTSYVRIVSPYSFDTATYRANGFCNMYTLSGSGTNNTVYLASATVLRVYDNTITSIEDARAKYAATPLQVVLPLATSQSWHIPDVGNLFTYLGINNIWIDTGAITECDYPADTKLYIDNKIATAIANALNA